VGAGGRAIHAEPPLNSGTAMPPPPPLSCIGRREITRDAEERNPGRVGHEKKRRKDFLLFRVWWAAAFYLGLSYLGPLANQLSFTMMMIIPFMPKTKTHA